MSQQLSEMTEEVKALGADLVRDLHPHSSFHEQIVTINNRLEGMTAVFVKLWRYFGRPEPIPASMEDWIRAMHKVPKIADWMRHSACRQGAYEALSLVAMWRPRLQIPDITYGFPYHNGVLNIDARDRAQAKARPYATRVAKRVNIRMIMPSLVPPEDEQTTPHRDFARAHPFAAALDGNLTTYPDDYDQWGVGENVAEPAADEGV